MSSQPDTFYKSFSEKKLTTYGSGRRGKIERHRLELLHRYAKAPGDMFEIGPGHGSLAEQAVEAGWNYTAVEASPILIDVLRKKGLKCWRHGRRRCRWPTPPRTWSMRI